VSRQWRTRLRWRPGYKRCTTGKYAFLRSDVDHCTKLLTSAHFCIHLLRSGLGKEKAKEYKRYPQPRGVPKVPFLLYPGWLQKEHTHSSTHPRPLGHREIHDAVRASFGPSRLGIWRRT
jgi:hypothetical protein